MQATIPVSLCSSLIGTEPQLLPGRRSINGCPLLRVCVHGVCVFTAVCAHFGWVNCRAQIPSMSHHTWSYVTSLSLIVKMRYDLKPSVHFERERVQGFTHAVCEIMSHRKFSNYFRSYLVKKYELYNIIISPAPHSPFLSFIFLVLGTCGGDGGVDVE